MKQIAFDVETNGLLEDSTVVHCLVLRDMQSDRVVSCTDSAPGYTSIKEGLELLSSAERVYAHNGIKFDEPVLRKLYPGFAFTGEVKDTYLIASMRWAHIELSDFQRHRKGQLPGGLIGSHKLEAWGYRLGVQKTGLDIEDWSHWTAEMQSRCETDTLITKALAQRIRAAGVSQEAVTIETELAYYLFQQEQNGWPFDVEAAVALQGSLAAQREMAGQWLREFFGFWFADGGLAMPKRNNKTKGIVEGCPYSRLKVVEFNPASRVHIAQRLNKLYGWTASQFTDAGRAQVDENVLKGLDYPPIEKLREYLLLDKRLGQIAEGKEAWLKHITTDGPAGGKLTGMAHIHGRVIQNKAITHRAAHAKPNVGQVPKVGNPYGAECRSLWRVPEGWVQLGADASGLELRCLAHFMAKYDDGAYAQAVLSEKPNDVHTLNTKALNTALRALGVAEIDRDHGKTFIYAWLYGAGALKRGKILAPGLPEEEQERIGNQAAARFLKAIPALKYLLKSVDDKAKDKGWLYTLDGRRVYIRHQHAALNTLLQTAGAIICKRWIIDFNRRLQQEFKTPPGGGWQYPWAALGWIHDEVQLAVRPDVKDVAAEIVVDSMRQLTEHFHFRCPLDGEAKFGANWKETH